MGWGWISRMAADGAELPKLVTRVEVLRRLQVIFPEGTPNRGYCTREMAASTVFAMLYIGAVDGGGRYLGPRHVYRMTDLQAAETNATERVSYAEEPRAKGQPWYADNSREPIRDETLRDGLVRLGAVISRSDLPTTSGKPRYALCVLFGALFDPALVDEAFTRAAAAWQQANLTPSARARMEFLRQGLVATDDGVLVTFPNGQTRRLAAGDSSAIAKAVVEQFAPRYLNRPGVLWLSESRNKVVLSDEAFMSGIGLRIDAQRILPDLILIDAGPSDPLLVFVEIVATDGPVTPSRQQALLDIATSAGFRPDQVAFVTAYLDRGAAAFKKTVDAIAWRSFAWFASEPDQIVVLRDGSQRPARLIDLLE